MKKEIRYRLFGLAGLLGLLLLCITGCNKDDTQTMLRITRTEYVPEQQQKSYIGLGLQDMIVTWQTTDHVNVNNNDCILTNIQNGDADANASTSSNGYAAVYPYTGSMLTGTGSSSTGGSVTISSSQTYSEVTAGSTQKIDAPMAGIVPAGGGVLRMRNIASLLRVAVMNGNENKSFTVSSITVSASNSVNLSGTQEFTFPGSKDTRANDIGTGSLSSGSNVTLTGCSAAGAIVAGGMKVFNIVVAPYSDTSRLSITVNGTLQGGSAKDYTITQNTARTLSHGEVAVQFFATNFDKQ